MNWLFFTLCAVAINTSLGLGLRGLTKKAGNPRITGFVYNCYAAAASVMIWLISGAPLPSNVPLAVVGLLFLSALGYGTFQRGQFYLRKQVEVSQLTPVMQTGVVFGFIASILVLGEVLTPKKLLGASIILCATLLVSLNKKLSVNKYASIAIVISAALSVAGVIDKVASPHFPLYFYTMLIWIIPLPFIAFPTSPQEIKTAAKQAGWKIPLLATLNSLSLVFFVHALQIGEASQVIPVLSTVTVLTVLGGIIILGERDNWQRKVLAGILATVGVLILR